MNMTDYNTESLVLWFDDLGTGNEEYRFLSNFYEGEPITLEGVTWEALLHASGVPQEKIDSLADWRGLIPFKTGEHAFQAMKFWGTDYTHFYDIVNAGEKIITEYHKGKPVERLLEAPNHAKMLGRSRKHPLRPDWEVVKLDLMAAITRAKYAVGREETDRLLATGDRLLVEGTLWGDDVWGVALDTEGAPGRNWLGTLLMVRRAEVRAWMSVQKAADDHRPAVLVRQFVENTGFYNTAFSI